MATKDQVFSYITKKGLSRQNRFSVVMTLPEKLQQKLSDEQGEDQEGGSFFQSILGNADLNIPNPFSDDGSSISAVRNLDIMCESAQLPGRAFETSDARYNADYITVPYAITYQPITLTFLVSQDFVERNIFDQWQELVVNPYTHTVGYFQEIVAPVIEINQLNQIDQTVYRSKIVDAYPSNVNLMEVDNTADNTLHKLTVEFTFRRFENEQIDTEDTVDALAQTPLGPFTTPILSNPAVQSALDFIEGQTGLDLEGEAVAVYNQIDQVVRNSTDSSTNQSVSLLNSIKASLGLTGDLTPTQISQLIQLIDDTISRLT